MFLVGLEGRDGVVVRVKKKWEMAGGKGGGAMARMMTGVIELVLLQLGKGSSLNQGQWLKGEDIPTNVRRKTENKIA